MEVGEYFQDFEYFLEAWWKRKQGSIWTAMPGVVNAWNYPSKGQNTVKVVPAVMGAVRQTDGSWLYQPIAAHDDVPVKYFGGGGFHVTHPIAQGDEGLIVYASRCIDAFWQNGGVQPRPDYGADFMHDLGDAMFIPGKLSDAGKLTSISQTDCQLRSTDGTSYLSMLASGGGFKFVTPGGTTIIDGSGNVTTTGNLTAGQGGSDQVELQRHTHAHGPVPDPGS